MQGAFGEPGIHERDVADELAAELASMAGWLGLDDGIVVAPRGDLAPSLPTCRGVDQLGQPITVNSAPSMSANVTVYSSASSVICDAPTAWPPWVASRLKVTPVDGSNSPVIHRRCEPLGDHGDEVASGRRVAVDRDEHLGGAAVEQDLVVRFRRDDRVVERAAGAALGNFGRRVVAAAGSGDHRECDDGPDGGDAAACGRGG